jgi:hypothetical protein
MTPLLPASALARDNELSHKRLAQRMDEIRTSVRESGHEAVTAGARRRLFGKVVAHEGNCLPALCLEVRAVVYLGKSWRSRLTRTITWRKKKSWCCP